MGTRTVTGPLLAEVDAPPVGALLDVVPAADGRPGGAGDHGARALTARVLEVGPDRLVLSPPTDVLGTVVPLAVGLAADLVWSEHGDVVGLRVQVGLVTPSSWSAEVTAPPQRVQRRDAVRAPVRLRATLSRAGGGGTPSVPGTAGTGGGADRGAPTSVVDAPVDDLSESGARCVVDPVELRLEHGARVLLDLPVDGLGAPLLARVVHRRFRPGSRGVLVGLRFVDVGDADADTLRRFVFARLRELRRRGAL